MKQTRITSSHWGAFGVVTENGRITGVTDFPEDPNPSAIPHSLPGAIYHKSRVMRPSIRRGWLENGPGRPVEGQPARGQDEFVELPWDEALDIAAKEIERVRNEYGNRSIFGGSYGWGSAGRFHHAQSQIHRFLNCAGGYVASQASYSTAAAQAIIPHVFGSAFLDLTWEMQNSWPMIADNTRMLVMFGGISPKNSQVSMGGVTHHETMPWFREFDRRGIRRVNISPQRTDTPDGAEWLAVIPGTDTALMLGLAHVLASESLADQGFLDRYCTGYDKFLRYLMGHVDGEAKTAEWAAEICGMDAAQIRQLARDMAANRTLITVAWSLQRAVHGEQPFWMAATLGSMLGQIGLPGGGIGYGYGAIGGIGVSVKTIKGPTLPQFQNPVSELIPVARIADMLLQPGKPFDFNGKRMTYPDIRLVYWCGGNPFHHHQDLNRLERAWQQPDTIIVNESWWTATAQRADIVFPATTPYERNDIGRAQGDSYLFHMPKCIEPVGESRDDYDIFSGLAKRLGCVERFTENRNCEDWLRHLYRIFTETNSDLGLELPDYDELIEKNWVDLPVRGAEQSRIPFDQFRQNPDANPLGTPSGRIEIYSNTIAGFGYDDCRAHPSWIPPTEWLGAGLQKTWPLHLVSPQPADKLHSQLQCAIADQPGARPVAITINPGDAQARQISAGDIVRVHNDRGSCLARARLSDEIMPGVVALPTGAWFSPDKNGVETQGNPNVLTPDRGTSRLGQGSSAHTCLVEVERAADSPE